MASVLAITETCAVSESVALSNRLFVFQLSSREKWELKFLNIHLFVTFNSTRWNHPLGFYCQRTCCLHVLEISERDSSSVWDDILLPAASTPSLLAHGLHWHVLGLFLDLRLRFFSQIASHIPQRQIKSVTLSITPSQNQLDFGWKKGHCRPRFALLVPPPYRPHFGCDLEVLIFLAKSFL